MKRVLCLLVIANVGCSKGPDPIVGDWTVDSKFYRATCRIEANGDVFDAWFLDYDDGTTSFEGREIAKRYYFKNLKSSQNRYIDGMSGATNTSGSQSDFTLKLIHKDTLIITTNIMNQVSDELWIRKLDDDEIY